MRILSTALLTAICLGSAIVPGWCPEPADLKSSRAAGTGATAAVSTPQCEDGPQPELCRLKYGRKRYRSDAMDRMTGSPINPAGSGKAGAGGKPIAGAKYDRPSATIAAKPAAGGAALQPPPRLGPIDYGGCAGCGKKDTFRQPR